MHWGQITYVLIHRWPFHRNDIQTSYNALYVTQNGGKADENWGLSFVKKLVKYSFAWKAITSRYVGACIDDAIAVAEILIKKEGGQRDRL